MTKFQRAFLTGFLKVATLTASLTSQSSASMPSSLSSPMIPGTTKFGPTINPPFNSNSQVPQLHAPPTQALPIQQTQPSPNSWMQNFRSKDLVDNAIRPAEGNKNYGVLTKFKNTTNEQASMNTVDHAFRDFKARGGGSQADFIKYLGHIYAPTKGATNDPRHLNNNWIPNVLKLWQRHNAANQIAR